MNFNATLRQPQSLAEIGVSQMRAFLSDPRNRPQLEVAMRIRAVENALYAMFGKGRLHGTIHTCIGQEFSGVLLGKHLRPNDFVFSNHRCHGHFIAATGNWRGLIDELVGNRDGVCAGIGSSQHLYGPNFISNGQQGGLLPVAAGVALDRKLSGSDGVAVSFIGEGTLGEGVVYETLNLDALWDLPHLVICENNYFSQSTPQSQSVAGDIAMRAAAFGIRTFEADTWDLVNLDASVAAALEHARGGAPAFLVVRTFRLNPHSKGDDQRDAAQLQWFRERDPLNILLTESAAHRELYEKIVCEVEAWSEAALGKPGLVGTAYFHDQIPRSASSSQVQWRPAPCASSTDRVNQQINNFYRRWFQQDSKAVLLGEDIGDPYGGAFKVTKGLPTEFGVRVRTTPISEAGITGAGIGLALAGRRAIVEIMFGDFVTYAFDQLVNNASKFFHMYNGQISCPVVLRTPMGGRRGYGPTHSQSLERFLVGIDNCCVLSLSSIVDVEPQLNALHRLEGPAIVIENKVDYTLNTYQPPDGFSAEVSDSFFPTIRIRPSNAVPDVTLVSYGGMARNLADRVFELFDRADAVPEILVLTSIHPIDLAAIAESAARTGRLVTIEEGAGFGGVGAEVLAQIGGLVERPVRTARVSGKPVPIPSAPPLEEEALPGMDEICDAIRATLEQAL